MKKLIIVSLMLFALTACDKNTFKIDIEMQNANGKMIYLKKIIDDNIVCIDSTIIQNNKAIFDVRKNDDKEAHHIFIEGWRRAMPFFADNKDVIIKGDFNAYNKIEVMASETQILLDEFNKKANDLSDEELKSYIDEFLKNHSQNELAPYILYRYKWAYDLDELRQYAEEFETIHKKGYIKKIREYITMLERTEVGQPYINFTLNNIDDQTVTLSSMIHDNKLVMIDFWASWCPDCRVENPNIVAVYNDFKDKGLDILSVSLDTNRDSWIKGINDDNLYWEYHVSELKGWNCPVANAYGVAFIPQNFLIDTNGIIVAKNLNGDDLRNFVDEYFK